MKHIHKTIEQLEEEIPELCKHGCRSWSDLEKLYYCLASREMLMRLPFCHGTEEKWHPKACAEIEAVLSSPPCSWAASRCKPEGTMEIVCMELVELKKACDGMKACPPTSTHAQVTQELKHTAAAIILHLDTLPTCL